ncbi:MAG: amino acid adenylation domain-containing protein [Deltaproteobacteria bacterium]
MKEFLLHHLLAQSARQYAAKEAFVCRDQSITYEELERKSDALALTLLQMGLERGNRVGIFLGKSLESIISLFGILKAGGIYVPIDPMAPPHRVEYILGNCDIECLVAASKNIEKLFREHHGAPSIRGLVVADTDDCDRFQDSIPGKCVSWSEAMSTSVGEPPPLDISDTSPAYILHTSGSTGNPKGVVLSHLNALAFVRMAADFFNITPGDRFCSQAPLHFDLSVFDIFVGLQSGATVMLLPEVYSTFPIKMAEYIEKERISVWNSVSSVLALLLDKGALEKFNLDSLRIVHFSGDVMPVRVLRALRRVMRNASFYNIYGQTEANSSMFYPVQQIPEHDGWRIPIGKSFPNFDVFAVRDSNELVTRPGEEGELFVGGSTVALGYWDAEDMTSEKFVPDPRFPALRKTVYRTGDLVRLDDQGNFVFAGRKDQMVKSRGYRIELEEIEAVLLSHLGIRSAVVIPIPDDLIGNRIVAVIVPEDGRAVTKESVAVHCASLLPKYMIPETVDFWDSLPKTSSGKIDRTKIRNAVIGT